MRKKHLWNIPNAKFGLINFYFRYLQELKDGNLDGRLQRWAVAISGHWVHCSVLVRIQYSRDRGSPWGGHLDHSEKSCFLEMVKTFAENSGSTCIIAGHLQMRKKPNEMMIFYIRQNQPWRNILNRSSLMVRHPILSLMRLVFVKLKVKIRQLQENNFQNLIPTKHFLCLLDIPCSIKTLKI